jgi:hypothetical protein
MWLIATALVVTAVAVGVTLPSTWRTTGAASAPGRPVLLHDAVARGTLVAVNRRTNVAEFRIWCGWHTAHGRATTKLPPGLYRVRLRGATFNVEAGVNANVPGSGVANYESLSTWEQTEGRRPGWHAWMSLYRQSWFSDGPSTSICQGVFG